MADREVALERLERGLVEDLGDQAHVLVDQDLAAVADRDAGRLLAAVLERVEAEVGELGDVLAGGPDAEDAAGVLGSAVLGVEVVRQRPSPRRRARRVWAGHGPECNGDRGRSRPGRARPGRACYSRPTRYEQHAPAARASETIAPAPVGEKSIGAVLTSRMSKPRTMLP